MILIADSGASKTEWSCVSRETGDNISFMSQGYNPNYITREQIQDDIIYNLPKTIDRNCVTEIHFYGAGVTPLQYPLMADMLAGIFPSAREIHIAMDLLAAARALLGREAGFAAILGTGSNSCLYDGEKETLNIDSAGFILGDEGSGAHIGKRLITDFIRGLLPEKVQIAFSSYIGMSGDELINTVYTKPFPNRFCASLSKYVAANIGNDAYYGNLVHECFRDFFKNIVSRYPDYETIDFNCVGSVGYHYKDILSSVAGEFGMKTGKIIKNPMPGLIAFHI